MKAGMITILLVLLLSGCASSGIFNGGTDSGIDYEQYVGTEGVNIEFDENTPPETAIGGKPIPVRLAVRNVGAIDIPYDRMRIFFSTVREEVTGGLSPLDPAEQDRDQDALHGRSLGFQEGEIRRYSVPSSATFVATHLKEQEGLRESWIRASVCYDYETHFAADVCVDMQMNEENLRDQSCTWQGSSAQISKLLSRGQGAPIAIVEIGQKVGVHHDPAGGHLDIPTFVLGIENVGSGYLVGPETLAQNEQQFESACLARDIPRELFGGVRVNVSLSGTQLECSCIRSQCTGDVVQLQRGKAEIECSIPPRDVRANPAYLSRQNVPGVLSASLSYIYIDSETAEFEVVHGASREGPASAQIQGFAYAKSNSALPPLRRYPSNVLVHPMPSGGQAAIPLAAGTHLYVSSHGEPVQVDVLAPPDVPQEDAPSAVVQRPQPGGGISLPLERRRFRVEDTAGQNWEIWIRPPGQLTPPALEPAPVSFGVLGGGPPEDPGIWIQDPGQIDIGPPEEVLFDIPEEPIVPVVEESPAGTSVFVDLPQREEVPVRIPVQPVEVELEVEEALPEDAQAPGQEPIAPVTTPAGSRVSSCELFAGNPDLALEDSRYTQQEAAYVRSKITPAFSCACDAQKCSDLGPEKCLKTLCPGATYCCDQSAPPRPVPDVRRDPTVSVQNGKLVASESASQKVQVTVANINKHNLYPIIREAAIEGASIPQILAIITMESEGDPGVDGPTGDTGVMQFTPIAAVEVGLCDNAQCSGRDERRNPAKAIPAGAERIAAQYAIAQRSGVREEKERIKQAAAGYSKGSTCIRDGSICSHGQRYASVYWGYYQEYAEVSGTGSQVAQTFRWPSEHRTITSCYGERNVRGGSRDHEGLDIRAFTGDPIYATDAGVVKQSYYSSTFGNTVVIEHDTGLSTRYAHLSKRGVSEGNRVTAGQRIGTAGCTGRCAAPHLHLEVYTDKEEEDINPICTFAESVIRTVEFKSGSVECQGDGGTPYEAWKRGCQIA